MSNTSNLRNILIIRLSSIGDIVLATHLPRIIKKQYPKSRLDFVTSAEFKDLLIFNPYIDNLITYDRKEKKIINGKLHEHYDIIGDLQKNIHSKKIISSTSGNINKIDKHRVEKLKMVYLKSFPNNISLVPIRYLNTFNSVVKDDNMGLEVWTKNDNEKGQYHYSQSKKIEIIGIAPGANHFTKRWPIERFIKLSKKLLELGMQVRFFGGPEDVKINDEVSKYFNQENNYIGKLKILETTEKISNCDLFITNDTGLMHIAAAKRIPIISIFGSSVKEFGFLPYKTNFRIIEKNISCRPCSHIGKSNCPKKHFKCMLEIGVDDVLEEFNNFKIEIESTNR